MKRIVGIDFGEAKLGIAITDPMQIIATPLTRIDVKGLNHEKKVDKLLLLLDEYKEQIECLVVGLPLEKSGLEGPMAKNVREFVSILEKKLSFPIYLFDERLTSKQAMRSLKDQGLKRKKATFLEDQTAACLMLQNFMQTLCT